MRLALCAAILGWCLVFAGGPWWLQFRIPALVTVLLFTVVMVAVVYRLRRRRLAGLFLLPLAAWLADAGLADYQVSLGKAFAIPRHAELQGWVCSRPAVDDGRVSFDFCVEDPALWLAVSEDGKAANPTGNMTKPDKATNSMDKARKSGHHPAGPQPGERVSMQCYRCKVDFVAGGFHALSLRLKTVRPLQNPGDWFSWQRSWRQGLWQGTVKTAGSIAPRFVLQQKLFVWRQMVFQRLIDASTGMTHWPTLLAMVLGDSSRLEGGQWEQLRQSGLMHLVVVSGLHVSMVAALGVIGVRILLQACGVRNARRASLWSGVGLIGVYLLLVGFAVPVFRASVMSLVVITALLLKVRAGWLEVYLLAVLCTVWADPLAFVAPGSWLSFIAVLVLMLDSSNRGVSRHSVFVSMPRLQVMLSLAMLPLVGFFYGEASLSAFILNLPAVPLVTVMILPLGMLKTMLALLSPAIAGWLDLPMDWLLEWFWWLAKSGDVVAAFSMIHSGVLQIFLVMLVVLAFIVLRHPVMVVWLLAGLGALGYGRAQNTVETDRLDIVLLDVGQGLSVAVQQGVHNMLYDTGSAWPDGWNNATRVILPFFYQSGFTSLETLIVSHGDNDHAGGVPALGQAMAIGQALMGEPHRSPEVTGVPCQAGQRIRIGKALVRMLWPVDDGSVARFTGNNRSCVFLLEYAGRRMLFTGDLEVKAQRRLLEIYGKSLQADVLLLPHHGARSSFYPDLLSAVNPSRVVVSAGFRNRFGHPHPLVIKWLGLRGIEVENTGWHGAIRLSWSPGEAIDTINYGIPWQ